MLNNTESIIEKDKIDDKYVFFVIKLFIYAGYGFNLISAIMLYAAGYTKDEKEKMKKTDNNFSVNIQSFI